MRCNEPIEVTLSIPVPIDKPDGDNRLYTKEAFIDAVKNFNTDAYLVCNNNIIGIIKSIDFLEDNNHMIANGIIFSCGTDEIARSNEDGLINKMKIRLFGIE